MPRALAVCQHQIVPGSNQLPSGYLLSDTVPPKPTYSIFTFATLPITYTYQQLASLYASCSSSAALGDASNGERVPALRSNCSPAHSEASYHTGRGSGRAKQKLCAGSFYVGATSLFYCAHGGQQKLPIRMTYDLAELNWLTISSAGVSLARVVSVLHCCGHSPPMGGFQPR